MKLRKIWDAVRVEVIWWSLALLLGLRRRKKR